MIKRILFIFLILKVCLNTDCFDGTTCPGNQKCCAVKDGISCCPYTNGVCCPDMIHCCPSGYICHHKGACLPDSQNKIKNKESNFIYEDYEIPLSMFLK